MDDLELNNKNIIYSDTVLSLNQNYSDFEKTTVFNISEYSLETFLNIILESNKDVKFNVIKYSPKDKKVCFYTDKEIYMKKEKINY